MYGTAQRIERMNLDRLGTGLVDHCGTYRMITVHVQWYTSPLIDLIRYENNCKSEAEVT